MPEGAAHAELTAELLARVHRVEQAVGKRPEPGECERDRTARVHRATRQEGLFALMLPKALGGMEVPLTVAITVWEAVCRIDSSAGWNLSQAGGAMLMLSNMGAAGLDRIMAVDPLPVFAGAAFPPGKAIKVDGGYRVTARVPFASGCRHADWLFLPGMVCTDEGPVMDPVAQRPEVRMAFFRREEVEIIDTWHVLGMRGTESSDIQVTDVFVLDDLAVKLGGGGSDGPHPAFTGPLYRMGAWPVINGEAVAALASLRQPSRISSNSRAPKCPPPRRSSCATGNWPRPLSPGPGCFWNRRAITCTAHRRKVMLQPSRASR